VEFWRYYRIIRKRRWLIILGMIICVGAVGLSNLRTPELFTGRTTLMESKGMSREGIPLFQEQYVQLDLQLRLSNLGNIATSQRVMSNAAQTLQDIGFTLPAGEILRKTKVQPVRDTNILAVEVTLDNPKDAKIAADVVAAEFKKVYNDLNNAAVRQSREFIQAQLETTRVAMVKAQNAVKDFKEQNDIVELDQQGAATVQRLVQAKTDYHRADADFRAAQMQRMKIEEELKDKKLFPEWETVGTSTARDPIWQKLTDQLTSLETEKARMIAGVDGQPRRLKNHPEVQAVDRTIADIKRQLAERGPTAGSNDSNGPFYLSAKSEAKGALRHSATDRWVIAKVGEVGAGAQRAAYSTVESAVRSEMASFPAMQARLAELQTDVIATTNTYGLMRSKLDEARIKEQQARNEVALKTIDSAYVYPVDQRKSLKLMLALFLSPLLGVGAAFLLHYTDNTVKTAADAEKVLALPVHAEVPGARAHALARQKCSEVIEIAYQMLTSRLWIISQNQGINSFALVSAEPDVGRSVTASNVAVSLAREGARVILVDADLRKPTQHLIFGVDNKVGLTNLLSGAATIDDVLIPTRVQGLLLAPSGPTTGNPVKLLRGQELKDFADEAKRVADFVIYDTPAGVAFPDPVLVASQVGSAIVVQAAGRVPRGSETELSQKLRDVGVEIVGAILNKVKREDSSGYFHYRRSYEGVPVAALSGGKKTTGSGA